MAEEHYASPDYPNIPINSRLGAVAAQLSRSISPKLLVLFQQRTSPLMPELQSLLQKRNDHPQAITAADECRMAELNAEVVHILQECIVSQN